MRKLFNWLLIATFAMIFASCTSEVDDVFDKSSALRIEEAMKTYNDVLKAPANGWRMEYYGDTKYGGYNMFVKFNNDNTVTVANEVYGPGERATSHYKLEQSAGVVLSFDEFNELFHFFSDPDNVLDIGADGEGMLGDLEYRILKCTADSVILKGKKHGSRIVMTPFSGDWDTYIDDVLSSEEDMAFASYYYIVGGTDTAMVTASYRQLTFNYTDADGAAKKVDVPYIVQPNALHLYEPIEIMGETITDFEYKGGNDFLFSSNTSNAVMKGYVMPLSEALLSANWYISYFNMSPAIQAYWNYATPILQEKENGETIAYAYYSGSALYMRSGNYWMAFNVAPQVLSDTQVTYTFKGYAGSSTNQGNANYYWNSATADGVYYFRYFVMPLLGTFNMEANDLRNPTELVLTNVENPQIYFKLTKQAYPASQGMN